MLVRNLLLVALAALLTTATLPAAAERPLDGDCDDSGVVVCAGMDLGASVQCSVALDGSDASCAWTFGALSAAFSPLALPGHESHVVTGTITICTPGQACSTTPFSHEASCAWAPAFECGDSYGPNPGATDPVTLLDGECVTVTVALSGTIDAEVVDPALSLATVSFSNEGGDAGSACFYSNGRD